MNSYISSCLPSLTSTNKNTKNDSIIEKVENLIKKLMMNDSDGDYKNFRGVMVDSSIEDPVDLLILGAGWTAQFLIPFIEKHTDLTYSSTTRSGGGKFNSIKFNFEYRKDQNDEEREDLLKSFRSLPLAKNLLVTFPIKDDGSSEALLRLYGESHSFGDEKELEEKRIVNVIQLGSTGIFNAGPTLNSNSDEKKVFKNNDSPFIDRHSSFDLRNDRARSEDELLKLNDSERFPGYRFKTTVLNLSGLWGNDRNMRDYVHRVAPTKEILRNKTSIHMIHGLDVSRSILKVIEKFEDSAAGQRWILTDGRFYDWWDLASAWGESGFNDRETEITIGKQSEWVRELMKEDGIRALPRTPNQLGRVLDSLEFWSTFELSPVRARLEFPN